MMPGDRARNPKGNIDFIERDPALRYKYNAKPGQVRNPYGRKGYAGMGIDKPSKITNREFINTMEQREMVDLARQKARRAMEVYDEIMDSETSADTAKLQAANAVLDRAFGKATQTNVNTNVNADGKPSEIDYRELNTRIDNALKRIEEATGGTEQAPTGEDGHPDLRKLN